MRIVAYNGHLTTPVGEFKAVRDITEQVRLVLAAAERADFFDSEEEKAMELVAGLLQ